MEQSTVLLLVALVAFIGSMIQSCSGFGYAILCMTFWTRLMPFVSASIIEAVTAFFMVVYLAVRLWRHIDFKLLLPPLLLSTLFSFLGVHTLMSLSDAVLQKILGVALLALACYFIFFSSRVHLRPTAVNGMIAGMISGFSGGLFNIGGPPIVAYFLSITDDKNKYNATLQAYFTLTTASIFFIHLARGNVTAQMLPTTAAALVGTALGTAVGFAIFKRLPMKSIKTFIHGFMVIAGCYLLFFT